VQRTYTVSVEVIIPDASDEPEDEFINVARAVQRASNVLAARVEGFDVEEAVTVAEVR
jgi:hypothetical protein